MKHVLSLFVLGAACSALAGISGTVIEQDPSGGLVTVTYSLDADAVVTVDFKRGGTSLAPSAQARVFGDVNRLVRAGTGRTIRWFPNLADESGDPLAASTLTADVTVWNPDNPPDWMVVDLVTTNTVRYYTHPHYFGGERGLTNLMDKATRMVFRKIPAKDVVWSMGQKGATTGRHKEHKVKLTKNYYMSVFIVTMQQFVLILPVNGGFPSNFSLRPEGFLEEYSCFRCKLKSHNDALDTVLPAFSAFTGLAFDLPTNAQCEYACRAGTTGNYNNGTDSSYAELAWCRDDDNTEHDVGLKKPNAWGLYDCHGLQREICSDWYENAEPADPPAGVDYLEDPTGPDNAGGTLTQKCYRGGRYADGNDQLRSYVFGGFDPKAANGCLRPIVMCAGSTAATTVTVSRAEAVCAPFATANGLKDDLDTRGPVSVESNSLPIDALPLGFFLFMR